MNKIYFPMSDYWTYCVAFIGVVILLLLFDLFFTCHKDGVPRIKIAVAMTLFWIGLALAFNLGFYFYALHHFETDPAFATRPDFSAAGEARRLALEFLSAFVVEKTLSVDNLFVFSVIFSYFAVPASYQHKVLFLGVLGAIFFRGIFIFLGMALASYTIVTIFFGLLLIYTGVKIFSSSDETQHDVSRNPALRLLKRLFPITPEYHGGKLVVRKGARLFITPLFVTIAVVEFSDIMFAIDSVPAVIALSNEPLIVFTSNIFAILGLRALYFVLAGCQNRFHLLRYGLGFVLVFIGAKMVFLNKLWGGHFPVSLSLGIVLASIVTSIVLSLRFPKTEPAAAVAN